MTQQVHQKLSGDPSRWYADLLEGAKAEQVRLEQEILGVRKNIRRLDLIAVLLTVFSTSAIVVSLGEFLPNQPKVPIVVAGLLNLGVALTVALKRFYEDNGVLFRLETLHGRFGDFFLTLTDPEARRHPFQIMRATNELEREIVRIAPEIRSPKPWDNMTESDRSQYLQQRIAQ